MKRITIILILMFLGFWSYSQSQGDRLITGKVICTQTGAGVNNFIVSCNFTDEGGLYDGTNVAIGHYLYFNDGGYGYYLPIDSVLSSGPSTVIVRVVSNGTGLGAVPSTIGYISEGTEHFEFFPFVSGIPNSDQQVNSENSFYILDSILYYRLPERISGTSPPGYTPTADQSWLVQTNGDGKLYRYDPVLTDWIEFGGLDSLNGIYSGSDTVPINTVAFLDSNFTFYSDIANATFKVQMGDLSYGKLDITDTKAELLYYNTLVGQNTLTVDDNGIYLVPVTSGSDDIHILGSVAFDKILTPSAIATNQNNYGPAGMSYSNHIRLSSSANVNITGLGSGQGRAGRLLLFHNVGTTYSITFKDESGSSFAFNRFALSDDYTLAPDDAVIAQYDTTADRWRLFELPRQYVDSLSMTNGTLRISLFNDKRPHKELDITENIQDIVGAMIGTQTNIAVTYNDGSGLISYVASGGGGGGSVIPDTFQIFNDVVHLSFLLDSIPATTLDISDYRQRLDTFEIVSDTLRASLLNDNVPFSFVDLTPYLDDTDNQTLDTFEIASNILRASLTDDGLPFKSVDLTPYLDNTDAQNLTIEGSGPTYDIAISGGTDVTISGVGITLSESPANTLIFTATDPSLTNEIQRLDTFEIVSNILRASLLNDGVPFSSVDLTPYTINIYSVNGTQDDPSRYFQQDSTMEFFMGQFANIPDVNYDGTEKGYYYSPDYLGGLGLTNGDGIEGDYTDLFLSKDAMFFTAQNGNNSARVNSNLRLRPDSKMNDMLLSTVGVTKINGTSRIIQAFNDTIDYIAIGHDGTGGNTRAYMTVGTGGHKANFYDKSPIRKFSWQYQKAPLNNPYLLLEGRIPATSVDTTADALWFYNGSYGWDNSRPIATNGIMSFHYWKGNATNTTPGFITMAQLADSVVGYNPTLYTGDGTADSREVEIDNFINWVDNNGDGEFNVSVGSTAGGNLFLTGVESKINYFNADGISTVSNDGSGIEISTTHALDPITINSANDINLSAIDVTGTVTGNIIFTNNSAATNERFAVSYDNGVSSTNSLQVKEGVGIWLQSSENNIILEGQTLLADMLTPSTIASSQNDYAGLDGGNFGRLDVTTAVNITGLDNGYSGRILPFYNISSTAITLTHNATSSSENRFLLPNSESLRLNQNDGAFFIYDSLSTKWRLISTNVGSLYTNSGQLLNGRSGDVYIRYQTDTLNDFLLGYFPNFTTTAIESDYGSFGLTMNGDGGFGTQGKETTLTGSNFNLLTQSSVSAGESAFDLTARSRPSIGVPTNYVYHYGASQGVTVESSHKLGIIHEHDLYQSLIFGSEKRWTGIPQNKKDYIYLYQGPGVTGSDTAAISMYLGIPQITDTIGNLGSGAFAVSRNRGWGVQSLYETGGTPNVLPFNIIKAFVPPAIADTGDIRLQLYGKYDMVNEAPGAGNRIMEWVNGVPGWINTPTGSGGGNGIYGGDGNIPAGGSEVTMDTIGETVRFTMNTGNTTLREMIRMKTVENAFTRFFVLQGPTDSMRVFRASAGREYTLQTYGGTTLTMASDSIIKLVGDSLLVTEDIVPVSGSKIRFIAGLTDGYYAKRVEAIDPDQILISDGTDWKRGMLAANESNVLTTIRPTQLAATTNDWNPTGYSTTKSQYIELSGDASFRTITGLTAATRDGVTKTLANTGTNCLIVAKLHTSSSAGNRFDIAKDVILFPKVEATFRYDSVGAVWKLVSTNNADEDYKNIVKHTFRDNAGTQTSSDSEQFLYSGNGGALSNAGGSGTSNRLRTLTLSTSTTSSGFPTISQKATNIFLAQNNSYISVSARIKTPSTLSTAAEDYDIRMGFETNADTTQAEGAVITYERNVNSGEWHVLTHDGSTPTVTDAGGTVATSTYYSLEIIYYPYGEIVTFINGTRTATTTTIPALLAMQAFVQIDKDSGSAARAMDVEAFDVIMCNGSE